LDRLVKDQKIAVSALQEEKIKLENIKKMLFSEQEKLAKNKKVINDTYETIKEQNNELSSKEMIINRSEVLLYYSILSVFIVIILALIIYAGYRRKIRSNNILKIKNEQIIRQSEIITEQSALVRTKALNKEEFLSNVSHEIRTPINTIVGHIELLSKESLNQVQLSYLDNLKMASKSLLYQVNDMLDYSKIQAGKIRIEQIPFDLHEVVNNSISALMLSATDKGVDLKYSDLNDVPQFVIGDAVRLNQILLNLISNAVKFTPEGKIEVILSTQESNDKIVNINFSVRDTGIGISEENQKHIFDKYTQSNDSINRRFGGTGLGLNISKTLVELFGGELKVKSEKDFGSDFYFTIQLALAPEEEVVVNFENDVIVKGIEDLEILLADDNQINRTMLVHLLKNWNEELNIDEAVDGVEVIDKVSNKKYDLILLDLNMPKLNGIEAAQYIRTKLKSNMKIVALTANATDKARQDCLDVGMNGFLLKPYILSDILKMIATQFNLRTEQIKFKGSNKAQKKQTKFQFLDLSRLNNTYDNEDTVKDLLGEILIDTDIEMQTLNESYLNNDWDKFIESAHNLLNKAPYLGGESFVNDCRKVEENGHKAKQGNIDKMSLDSIVNKWNDIRLELIDYLAK
jgi:signal transduction histidine kinase/CheY-like chemotaxis protein/HPt (histidine-containing phosphotransfer) domain-containing protein